MTVKKLKRWINMMLGKSIDHVNQDKGKIYSINHISGYYNNLTEKVTKNPRILKTKDLPYLQTEKGEYVMFPVAIFQYGLGAYDMYLLTNKQIYLDKFYQCAEWAISKIDKSGRWNNFFFFRPDTPYGAMAQGEGASLLIRAYVHSGDERFLNIAKQAIDFMLLPLEEGGTTKYDGKYAFLMEYTFKGMVFNGAIFAWWGLYDYVKLTHDNGKYNKILIKTLDSLIYILPKMKNSYWSMYSLDGLIASPFYHNLHIAQMEAMYDLTGKEIFKEYAEKWKKKQKNPFCYGLAFTKKAIQKILE